MQTRWWHETVEHYDTLPQSAPDVTGYGRLVMAESDDTKSPNESFSFDQNQERYSLYALKAYALPRGGQARRVSGHHGDNRWR